MTRTLIVSGLDGSPALHWERWWATRDPSAIMVDLSDPAHPVPAVWEVELAGMILRHPDCIVVGHSLRAVVVPRLLATWPSRRVRAALLVAPAATEGDDRIGHFGPIPGLRFDVPVVVAASRNDPWMTCARVRHLSQAWRAHLVDMGFAGHVNVESGFGPWIAGLALRDDLAARTAFVPSSVVQARCSLGVRR